MVVKRSNEKGIGLVLTLMILALLSMLVAAMLTAVSVEVWIGDNYRRETQLVYLAEAGIEDGRERMRVTSVAPSSDPFILDRPSVDTTGREVGRYSVTLVRSNPLTLRSAARVGVARRTVEARLKKSGFPWLSQAITLNEDVPLPPGMDAQIETTEGLERIVEGITRHATDLHRPGPGETFSLAAVGSPLDYRVVIVDGDAVLSNVIGYGLLLVRGELEVSGTVGWNGLVLVIGQGVMRATDPVTAGFSGAVFLARTRADDRSSANPSGTLLERRGPVTLDLPVGSVTIGWSPGEIDRANQRFPYLPTTYREY